MSDQPLHIIELRAENVKRIQAVTVRPDGNVVLIGGQNAQGKSSILDSIEMALGGGKTIPVEPVRRGTRKARIVLDLGEIKVERVFSPKGTVLEVRNAEGVPQKSPQALLDTLTSKVCFDPLAFSREEPTKQVALLKQILGLDFSELDSRRERLYEERRDANRDAKALDARIDAAPLHGGVPADEVSVSERLAELERLRQSNAEHGKRREALSTAKTQLESLKQNASEIERMIEEKRELLRALELDLESKRYACGSAKRKIEELENEVASLVDHDTAATLSEIEQAEQTNAKIRSNKDRLQLERELLAITQKADRLTDEINDIDEQKREALEAAQFPVEGLGFDETGPTLNGLPLAQASQAERLRVSVAIGAALHPRVRLMLIRDGSLLDDKSMALLSELALETGSQLWIERVGDKDASAIIIEDGMVVGQAEEPTEQVAE